jgi:rubredoxin-NAD+ reductase
MQPITIIGTGLAGYTVARELRKLDPNCPLRLITADDGHFYSKPMLSNAFSQSKTPDMLITTSVEQMAEQLQAEILTHTLVTQLEPQWHRIKLKETSLAYSQLVLACGAKPIPIPCTGTATAKILSVNSLSEYRDFRVTLQQAKHVTIIGAGLIGCEFANDLQAGGFSVTVISNATYPLNRLVPPSVGQLLQQILQERGITWLLGKTVKQIAQNASTQKYQLTLSDDQIVATDIVISAIGLRPQVKLATEADLTVKAGIVVNRYLQTNVPTIYALGDCAQIEDLVLLYVMPLMNAARALAKTLVGQTTAVTYPAMPIVVKTPACPIVVSPPPTTVTGQWQMDIQGQDIRGLFYTTNQQLAGFVLTGKIIAEKMTWLKQLPPLLSTE